MPTIDRASYQKAKLPIGHGYDRRPNGLTPSSILIHSTNGNRGSSLAGEANYLRDSAAVGAHYLVGKRGEIIELLDPALRAWHAGMALAAYLNSRSIGVEAHHALGEAWTPAQRDALTWLCRDELMPRYRIPTSRVDTHRAVALPKGRKVDPSDWADVEFYAWRDSLGQRPPVPTGLRTFQIRPDLGAFARVRQAWWTHWPANGKEVPISMRLAPGTIVYVDVVKTDGTPINDNRNWVHMAEVPGLQDDAGFVAEALGVWL
jgi:hypothetical protein